MKHNTETITDDDIEYTVSYEYDEEKGFYAELGNPSTWVQPTVFTKLTSVEVEVFKKKIDVLPLLTTQQRYSIIDKLTYNHHHL